MADTLEELREKVAISCRILSMMGLVKEIFGHVSARIPGTQEAFIRCRGAVEEGLPYTPVDLIQRVDLEGRGEGIATFGEVAGERYEIPGEFPIHGEILKARPEVGCVIHAHPPGVLLCSLGGVELRPIFGAYDPFASLLALGGIPVYPRSCLIENRQLASSMMAVMSGKNVCVLRGHGIVVAGRTVEEATIRAIKLESLARVTWELAKAGKQAPEMLWEDVESFTSRAVDLTSRADFIEWIWKHYVRMLKEGRSLPNDLDMAVPGLMG